MKLFTPSEARAVSQGQRALSAARSKDIEDALSLKRKELATLESNFQQLLASQRARWALEEQEHAQRVVEMTDEIRGLEDKRLRAVLPAELDIKRAQIVLEDAKKIRAAAEEKERETDRLQGILENKIDAAQESRERYDERNASLDRREKGIEAQAQEQSLRAAEFTSFMEGSLKGDELRKKQIAKKEQELNHREHKLAVKEESVDEKMNEIIAREDRVTIKEAMYGSPINESPIRK